MEAFCEKNMVPTKTSGWVTHLTEEVLLLQKDFSDIVLELSYSEKDGSLELSCSAAGEPNNPLEEGKEENELGLMILRGLCRSLEYQAKDGRNILLMKLRETSAREDEQPDQGITP